MRLPLKRKVKKERNNEILMHNHAVREGSVYFWRRMLIPIEKYIQEKPHETAALAVKILS